ncbi:hypothetical protein PV326_014070 [Microctonus aethiopoides]|nr:hypothetical protein PV326_014070 [Microctonus aethiopoides]
MQISVSKSVINIVHLGQAKLVLLRSKESNQTAYPNINDENGITDAYPKITSFNGAFIPGELHWDDKTEGKILGSFFFGYVITNVLSGRIALINSFTV